MKNIYLIVAILFAGISLHAQNLRIDIYKDGDKPQTVTIDSGHLNEQMAKMKLDMEAMQKKIDSLGKHLSALYSDSLMLYTHDKFEGITQSLQQRLDTLVEKMESERDLMNDNNGTYSYSYSFPGGTDDTSANQQYKIIINGNVQVMIPPMPPLPQPPPVAPCVDKPYEIKNGDIKWGELALGWNTLVDNNFNTSTGDLRLRNSKSVEVQLTVMKQYFNLIRHHLYFDYGVGFDFNNYRLPNDALPVPRQAVFTSATPDRAASKIKLSDTYVTVPVGFRAESNPRNLKHSFHFEAGGFGGYRINTHTKEVTTDHSKIKNWNDFNLNDFRYGVSAAFGYGPITLYANYALSDFFQTNEGPVYHPFSIGILLIND